MALLVTARAWIDRATTSLAWLAPFLVRVVIGVTFILTGWGKLHNLDMLREYFHSLGIPAADLQAPVVAGVEFLGGLMVVLGLGTRIAALFLTGVMAVAIGTAIWPKAPHLADLLGSVEAVYFAAFVYLAIAGAGAASADRIVHRIVNRTSSSRGSHASTR